MAVLTIDIMLYITSQILIYLVNGSLYPFDHLPWIPPPPTLPLKTTNLTSISMSLGGLF